MRVEVRHYRTQTCGQDQGPSHSMQIEAAFFALFTFASAAPPHGRLPLERARQVRAGRRRGGRIGFAVRQDRLGTSALQRRIAEGPIVRIGASRRWNRRRIGLSQRRETDQPRGVVFRSAEPAHLLFLKTGRRLPDGASFGSPTTAAFRRVSCCVFRKEGRKKKKRIK